MTIPNPAVEVPRKDSLLATYKSKKISEVQTPCLIIDRALFVENCRRMRNAVENLSWSFRAHVKTHKTVEGAKLQCQETGTDKLCASTIPEIRDITNAGLALNGTVKDILYTMPPAPGLLPALLDIKRTLADQGAQLLLMIDHPSQIHALEKHVSAGPWQIYLKLDIGSKRAGQPHESVAMDEVITSALQSPHVLIYGTYTHAGFSYAARDGSAAAQYLAQEISAANVTGKRLLALAKELGLDSKERTVDGRLRLAVGATPTAHAAGPAWEAARKEAGITADELVGKVELHAGNYCLLDLQQLATTLIDQQYCAMTVGTTVISLYQARQEALCDAGAIAMSKDTGPIPGFGNVRYPSKLAGWSLGRTSQEHGILVAPSETGPPKATPEKPEIGDWIQLIPQHACLTAAQFPWFYVVDGGGEIVDVWLPCKGW